MKRKAFTPQSTQNPVPDLVVPVPDVPNFVVPVPDVPDLVVPDLPLRSDRHPNTSIEEPTLRCCVIEVC